MHEPTRLTRLDPVAVLREAWRMFRRDHDVILRIGAMFMFLPSFALALLVPGPPVREPDGGEQAAMAWLDALGAWGGRHGGWYLLAYAIGYFGAATLYALHLDPARADVAGAMRRAVAILPRYLLAMVIVALPVGAGMMLLLVPGLYVLGRVMLTGAVLVSEGRSALRSIQRSMELSSGLGLRMMGLAAVPVLGGAVLSQPFLMLDAWMRGTGAANPVAVAIVDAGIALVGMSSGLAGVMIALAVWRRLAPKQI